MQKQDDLRILGQGAPSHSETISSDEKCYCYRKHVRIHGDHTCLEVLLKR